MGMPPQQQFGAIADARRFPAMGGDARGASAKSAACLADDAATTKLVQMQTDAISQYNVPGTPAFLINGSLVEGSNWDALEPKLRAAIGG